MSQAAGKKKKLSPSLEDYLEAVYVLVDRSGVARVRDIAKRLGVGMSSVTTAMKSLAKRKLVHYDPYEVITLTDGGREAATEINWRHELIRKFLVDVLGLDADTADANACRMEHAMDDALLDRLGCFAEFVRSCPPEGEDWKRRFVQFCKDSGDAEAGRKRFSQKARRSGGPTPQEGEQLAKTLDQIAPGRRAKVVKVGGQAAINRRLVDMGLTRGTAVSVLRVAPLGDPIEIKLRGYNLSIRKAEARSIEVEEVS